MFPNLVWWVFCDFPRRSSRKTAQPLFQFVISRSPRLPGRNHLTASRCDWSMAASKKTVAHSSAMFNHVQLFFFRVQPCSTEQHETSTVNSIPSWINFITGLKLWPWVTQCSLTIQHGIHASFEISMACYVNPKTLPLPRRSTLQQ